MALCLLLAAAVVFVYRETFEFKLLTWDDDQHVTENQYFKPLTWRSFTHFWVYSHVYLYIPISYNFFGVEVAIAQLFPSADPTESLNPAVFHVGNVLIHLGSTLLAFGLFRKLTCSTLAAWAGSLLFALHPLQTESVAWVGETRGTLCTLFCFASLWFYLKFAGVDPERGMFAASTYDAPLRRRRDYLLAFFCYAAALLSKPSAASWPLVVMAIDVVLLRRAWLTSLWRLTPWIVAAAFITGLTKHYQKTDFIYQPSVAPLWQRPFIAGDAYGFYLVKLFWPFELCFDYGRTPHRAAEMPQFYRAWLLPVLVGMILSLSSRRRLWLGCYAIFLLSIAPVSGIVPFLYQSISTVADRYMYVPLFGFGLMLSALLATRRHIAVGLLAAAPLLGLLAHRTIEQTATWRDDWTMYRHGLSVNPDSFMAHLNLGFRYRQDGQYEIALDHFRRVLALRPGYMWANYNRGFCFVKLERFDDAVKEYRAALKIDPNSTDLHVALGDVLALKEDYAEAEEHYRAAVRGAMPKEYVPSAAFAEFLYKRKRFDEGDAAFRDARERDPHRSDLDRRQGRALMHADRFAEALPYLESLVRAEPRSVEARSDLASCYYSLGKFGPAAQQAGEAARIDPKSFAARHNLALALAAAGKSTEAREQFAAALELVPPASAEARDVRRTLDDLR